MARKTSLKMPCVLSASLLLAMVAVCLGTQSAVAASYKRSPPVHRVHHAYATYRGSRFAHPGTLPYGPEYGFLAHVPPNAIRMPGYTFVPGLGILGESCDLPTSACDNRYRDVK
jgi:hypothetical protein